MHKIHIQMLLQCIRREKKDDSNHHPQLVWWSWSQACVFADRKRIRILWCPVTSAHPRKRDMVGYTYVVHWQSVVWCCYRKMSICEVASYVGWATWTMTKHIFSRQSVLVVCSCI